MKILITGGGGYLGKKLKIYLSPRHTVDCFSRQELDLTDSQQLFEKVKVYDAVIHCAASGRNDVFSTDPGIIANNLTSFVNLFTLKNRYTRLINIASGAEFDLTKDIYRISENEIWHRNPIHSYGFSKNLISRMCLSQQNFCNLRLFGCFDSDESEQRLLKKAHSCFSKNQKFDLQEDKEFDMVSFNDFAKVVETACMGQIVDSDINVVYVQKYRLSEILSAYCYANGFDKSLINILGTTSKNYSGNGEKLSKYNLKNLEGLHQAIRNYKVNS